jgi:hypothetical protein
MTTTIARLHSQDPFYDPHTPKDPPNEECRSHVARTQGIAKGIFSKERPQRTESNPVEDDNNAINEIDVEITPSNKATDTVETELKKITEMLKNPKYDIRLIIDQLCRISMALHRQGAIENKIYSLDKELELTLEIKEVKNTYNGWKVLTISIASGGLTLLGGVIGLAGVLPGTAAGTALASMAPKVLSIFKNPNIGTGFDSASKGLSGIGQGAGAFGKMFADKAEAERAVRQFILSQDQTKFGDRNQASASEVQLCRETLRKAEQAESEAHQTVKLLVDSRA